MARTFYDSLGINEDIVMDMSMLEATGTITHDESKSGIVATLHNGVIWDAIASGRHGVHLLEFVSRYLDASAADTTNLNFTTTDYSLVMWVYMSHWLDDDMVAMGRYHVVNRRGWEVYYYDPTNLMTLRHHHAGTTPTRTGAYSGGWLRDGQRRLFGVTREGATAQHYMNGQPVTTIISAGGLVDPDTSTDDLVIGCRHTKDTNFWTGHLHRPRAWSRALSADEHRFIFEMERDWYDL